MEIIEHPYFGVFFLFVFSIVAFGLTVKLSSIVGGVLSLKNSEKLKLSIFECGPETSLQPNNISTQFYLIALLSIVFDIEVLFMIPWAVDFKILGVFGFVEMLSFILLLLVGFVYAWRKGALQWHSMI